MTCPICLYHDWPNHTLDGMDMIKGDACAEHASRVQEILKNYRKVKVYTLKTEPPKKTVSDFVPKQAQVKPDWNDKDDSIRTPGEEG